MKTRKEIEDNCLLPDIQREILLDIRQLLSAQLIVKTKALYDQDFIEEIEPIANEVHNKNKESVKQS